MLFESGSLFGVVALQMMCNTKRRPLRASLPSVDSTRKRVEKRRMETRESDAVVPFPCHRHRRVVGLVVSIHSVGCLRRGVSA